MAEATKYTGPDGKPSMARVIAFMGAWVGAVALLGGLALAFVEAILKTGSEGGKAIAIAGLGMFTAGGLTKVGSGFAEAVQAKNGNGNGGAKEGVP